MMIKELSKRNRLTYVMNRIVLLLIAIIGTLDNGARAEIINESTIRNMIVSILNPHFLE